MPLLPPPHRRQDRVVALAGMLRAAMEAQEIARHGKNSSNTLMLAVQSILATDATDGISGLGGLPGLQPALQALCPLLLRGPSQAEDAERLRYTLSLAKLGRKILSHQAAYTRVQQGIDQARRQVDHFGDFLHPTVLAGLAATYAEGVGVLQPRIIVTGESRFLTQDDLTARIRVLLLSGIRAAVLWSQSGGHFWTAVWERKALCTESQHLLQHLPGHPSIR